MAKVIVYHAYYGCDTGCCGHVVDVFNDDVVARDDFDPQWDGERRDFTFDHPRGNYGAAERLAWARKTVREELGEEHVADLAWERCIISDD